MSARNRLAVLLTLISLGLLLPGLTQPILTISAKISLLGNEREIFRETQSILESVQRLRDSGNHLVAGLILLFSILVPLIKAVLFFAMLPLRNQATRGTVFRVVRSISKWSMADVFVVGTFIAFLAANALDNLDAVLGPGFHWFTAYCLTSNLGFQVMEAQSPGPEAVAAPSAPR